MTVAPLHPPGCISMGGHGVAIPKCRDAPGGHPWGGVGHAYGHVIATGGLFARTHNRKSLKLRSLLASPAQLLYTTHVQTNRHPPAMMKRSSLPGIAASR